MQSQQYAYDSTLKKWLPIDISAFSSGGNSTNPVGGATEAKQDDAIALLQQLTQKTTTDSIGTTQPPQFNVATSSVKEILPESGTRKRVTIVNNSTNPADFILIELNGDATPTQGIPIGAGGGWESPGREEARSRITVISGSGNPIDISYRETIDSVFSIGSVVVTEAVGTSVNLDYPITLINLTAPLSTMQVDLFEEGNSIALATQTINSGLIPNATINVVFSFIQGFNNGVPREFYIEVTGA